MNLDPDSIGKDPLIEEDYRVEIHFKDVCRKCKSEDIISTKCFQCRTEMEVDLEYWTTIQKIL